MLNSGHEAVAKHFLKEGFILQFCTPDKNSPSVIHMSRCMTLSLAKQNMRSSIDSGAYTGLNPLFIIMSVNASDFFHFYQYMSSGISGISAFLFFCGFSDTIASVVIIKPATDAAF